MKILYVYLGVFIVVAVVATVIVFLVSYGFNDDYCTLNTFHCRDHQVQMCLKSEQYSRDECIKLVSPVVK